jgi:hypothetical protein
MNKTKTFITLLLLMSTISFVQAQTTDAQGSNPKEFFNPLVHGVPSLVIAPDARDCLTK